ncbi:PspC domain-containing protein [Demequina sp. NBRC 110052]|uniref:PspC domain-containing protein n=1 Tax=Demequina sp. NBRC 110052 TaxID=1570341 RepID=UPI000A073A88|nr:PspC domain-containing protein [Demequina sp. NBRC 110052]
MSDPQQPAHEAAFFSAIRSWGITRGDHGVVGGVIEGVGDRIGLARVPARLIFVLVAIFTGGFAALAYAAGWGLLPDRRGNIIIQNFGRGVTNVGALLGIAVLTLIGLSSIPDAFITIGPWDWPANDGRGIGGVFAALWGFAILASVVWLVVWLVRRGRGASTTGAAPAAPHASDTAAESTGVQESPADTDESPVVAAAAPAPVYAALPGQAGPGSAPNPLPPRGESQGRPAAASGTYAPVPPVPPVPPQPPRPRIPGPGPAGYLSALAWLILSGVGVAIAGRNDELAVHPLVAWPVAVLVGWSVILIVVSLTGRKLGFLGFLTVLGVAPVLALGAGADTFREGWAEHEGIFPSDPDADRIAANIEDWIRDNIDPNFDVEVHVDQGAEPDPGETATLAAADIPSIFGDYDEVLVRGTCFTDAGTWDDASADETLVLSTVGSDREIVITAETTSLTIPEGTSLVLEGRGNAYATVAWLDRDVWCDFSDGDATYVSLDGDPEGPTPTLTLVVEDDAYANTILITETPVSTTSEVQE